MQLTYRGVNYTPQNAATKTPEFDLRYRGVAYRQKAAAKTEALNAVLTYRGVTYNLKPATQPVPEVPAFSIEEQARQLGIKHHQAVKTRQQAMLARSAAEVGLPGSIVGYWNRIQGKIHPSFWDSYDRSHVTLS